MKVTIWWKKLDSDKHLQIADRKVTLFRIYVAEMTLVSENPLQDNMNKAEFWFTKKKKKSRVSSLTEDLYVQL